MLRHLLVFVSASRLSEAVPNTEHKLRVHKWKRDILGVVKRIFTKVTI